MVICGGKNVYSVEVENVVASHPAVAQCAVIGVPSDVWREILKRVPRAPFWEGRERQAN